MENLRNSIPLTVCCIYKEEDEIHLTRMSSSLPPGIELILMKTVPVETPVEPFMKSPEYDLQDIITLITTEWYYYCENPDDPWNSQYQNDFSFSTAKNICKSIANRDWILFLDADEVLSNWQTVNWKSLFKLPGDAGGVLTWIFSAFVESNTAELVQNIRLFRNDHRIMYKHTIHERLQESLENNNFKVVPSNILIQHYGYSKVVIEDKYKRNLYLLNKELEQNPDNPIMLKYKAATIEQLQSLEMNRNTFDEHVNSFMKLFERA